MKKILVINGHPDKESLCFSLAENYKKGAVLSGANCKLVNLIDLHFNPNLEHGYREDTTLEPDLLATQQDILDAQHIVFVYPNWWGTYPALLKGFIDRVFLPGFAFEYNDDSPFCDKLLKGKTARLIVTMDAPKWYYFLVYSSPGHNSMKTAILGFCGINSVKITSLTGIRSSTLAKRQHWIDEIEELGFDQV